MFVSVYNEGYELNKPVADSEISVVCAGQISVNADYELRRPGGVPSYMLVFVYSGDSLVFTVGKSKYYINKGEMFIQHPYEPQNFTYLFSSNIHSYFIHFDGTEVDKILVRLGLMDRRVFKFQTERFKEIIDEMIGEMQDRDSYAKEVTSGLLYYLLSLVARENKEKDTYLSINDIVTEIKVNYAQNVLNTEYAKKCGISVTTFLKAFKEATGTTPQKFKLSIRILVAQDIIATTNMKLKEVATTVGFNDFFHFSKYFKQKVEISPTNYKKTHSKIKMNDGESGSS